MLHLALKAILLSIGEAWIFLILSVFLMAASYCIWQVGILIPQVLAKHLKFQFLLLSKKLLVAKKICNRYSHLGMNVCNWECFYKGSLWARTVPVEHWLNEAYPDTEPVAAIPSCLLHRKESVLFIFFSPMPHLNTLLLRKSLYVFRMNEYGLSLVLMSDYTRAPAAYPRILIGYPRTPPR